jgi:O-antigen/teichoic acid export membrane protein
MTKGTARQGNDGGTRSPSGPSRAAGFLKGSLLVAAATGFGQILAYTLNILGPRFLSPDNFGALGTLLNLLVISSVLPFGIQAVATRVVVNADPADRSDAGSRMLRFSLISGISLAIILCLTSPLLTSLLSQPNPWNIVLTALTLPALNIAACQYGLAQAHHSHGRLAALLAFHGLMRFGFGITLLISTNSVLGTSLGMAVGATIAAAIAHLFVRPFTSGSPSDIPGIGKQTLHASHALLALFIATNIDLLLARIYLTGDESGAYAVGAIISRVAFWLPFFIVLLAYARMMDERRHATTRQALFAAAALSAMVVGSLLIAPQLVLSLVAGPGYEFMASYLWLFGVVGSAFSLTRILLYAQLAVSDKRMVVLLWIDLIAIVTGITIWHGSVPTIAAVTAICAVLALVAGLLMWSLTSQVGQKVDDSG